jgi:hypothetical protein
MTGEQVEIIETDQFMVWCMAVVGKRIWAGTEDGPILIYDGATRSTPSLSFLCSSVSLGVTSLRFVCACGGRGQKAGQGSTSARGWSVLFGHGQGRGGSKSLRVEWKQ